MAAHSPKASLRDLVRTCRGARPEEERRRDDALRTSAVLAWCRSTLAPGDPVALYLSTGDEPDTWKLLDVLASAGHPVLLPVLDGGRERPDWAWYAGRAHLRAGWRGILEPDGDKLGPDALQQARLVCCSGLAASAGGYRLGVGGGWYDRALSHASPDSTICVLLHRDETLDAVPVEAHDHPVHLIASPAGITPCR